MIPPLPPLGTTPTDDQRAIHARWKPVADAAEAARHEWLARNRYPWERIGHALARYSRLRARERGLNMRAVVEACSRVVRRAPPIRLVWTAPPTPTAVEVDASAALDSSAAHLVKD